MYETKQTKQRLIVSKKSRWHPIVLITNAIIIVTIFQHLSDVNHDDQGKQ